MTDCSNQHGCIDCGRKPVGDDGLCNRHSRQYNGVEQFDDDRPLVGDECACVACSSDIVGIFPCLAVSL